MKAVELTAAVAMALSLALGAPKVQAESVGLAAPRAVGDALPATDRGPLLDVRLPPEALVGKLDPSPCPVVGLRTVERWPATPSPGMRGPLGRLRANGRDHCASAFGAAAPRARSTDPPGPRLRRVAEPVPQRLAERAASEAMAQRDRGYTTEAGQRLGLRYRVAEDVDLDWSLWTDLGQSATLASGNLGTLGVGTTARGLIDELKAAARPAGDASGTAVPALPFALALRLNLRFPPPQR